MILSFPNYNVDKEGNVSDLIECLKIIYYYCWNKSNVESSVSKLFWER